MIARRSIKRLMRCAMFFLRCDAILFNLGTRRVRTVRLNRIRASGAGKTSLCITAALLLTLCSNGQTDQSDPKLDGLFAQLREATNPMLAKRTEREIWTIWHKTPDDAALDIMHGARAALDGRDFKSAIGLLDKLVAYAPDFAEAWNQRAIVRYFAEDYSGSLRDIEQTLALEPRHFGAIAGRGRIYLHLNELELALKAFESALELNPWMDNIRSYMYMIRERINARPKPI